MKSKKVVEDKSAVSLYDKHIVQGESWDWDSTVQLFSAGVFATTAAVSAKGLKGDLENIEGLWGKMIMHHLKVRQKLHKAGKGQENIQE